jgi:hypothetical protein
VKGALLSECSGRVSYSWDTITLTSSLFTAKMNMIVIPRLPNPLLVTIRHPTLSALEKQSGVGGVQKVRRAA